MLGAGGAAGPALDARSSGTRERLVERLDRPLRAEEAALGDRRRRASAPPAAPRRSAGRRARSRRARSARRRRSRFRSADSSRPSRRSVRSAAISVVYGSSSAQPCPPRAGTSVHVYASEKPAPTSTSSTRRRSRCSLVSWTDGAARSGSVDGTSSIRKRTTSSTRSTGRVTSFMRHVGTRHLVAVDLEAEPLQAARPAPRRESPSRSAARRARAGGGRRAAPAARRGRRRARSSGRRRCATSSSVA